MTMMAAALLSTALLLLAPGVLTAESYQPYPVELVVFDSVSSGSPNITYNTKIVYRGILLGAMRKLKAETEGEFRFEVKEDCNYGPFLVSVNGLVGKTEDHTYWELLVKLQNGTIIRPDVGVGCYIPKANECIIFKYTKC